MIRNVPRDQWLYNDRGMMKWLGYFLSDHTQDMTDKKSAKFPLLAYLNRIQKSSIIFFTTQLGKFQRNHPSAKR